MRPLPARGPDLLLQAITAPATLARLDLPQWERVIACARRNRLLAYVAGRADAAEVTDAVPQAARLALQDAQTAARRTAQLAGWELREVARVLDAAGIPAIALKGAAYLLRRMPHARSRLVSDVDVMVPSREIDVAEAALLAAGYKHTDLDPYDDQYYRRWTHELPPLQFPGRMLGVDVHHTICPPVSRLRPDPAAFWAAAESIEGSGVRVLGAPDAFLHAAVHLFFDSDFDARLRDLVDLHEMATTFGAAAGFWDDVLARAAALGLGRPLHYAVRTLDVILASPVPPAVLQGVQSFAAPLPVDRAMRAMLRRALRPVDPAAWPQPDAGIRLALYVRSHWLRMPVHLLVPHLLHKGRRRSSPGAAA
jgi:hypothetical protein